MYRLNAKFQRTSKEPKIVRKLKKCGFIVLLVKGSLPSETIECIDPRGDTRTFTVREAANTVHLYNAKK